MPSQAGLTYSVGQNNNDTSLSGPCELDDGMVVDRSSPVISTIQSQTFARGSDKSGTDVSTRLARMDREQTDTCE